MWIAQNVDSVEQMMLSQESASGNHKTICHIEQEIGISKKPVHMILKQNRTALGRGKHKA